MKPAEKITEMVNTTLPSYQIVEGYGKTYDEFIKGEIVDGNAAYISYQSFTDTEALEGGRTAEPSETYTLYLRTSTDDIRDAVNAIRNYLKETENLEFVDDRGAYCQIEVPDGSGWHDTVSGNDIFELTINIL